MTGDIRCSFEGRALGMQLATAILDCYLAWIGPDNAAFRRLIAPNLLEFISGCGFELVDTGDEIRSRALPGRQVSLPLAFLHRDPDILDGLLHVWKPYLVVALRPHWCPTCDSPVAVHGMECARCSTAPEA